MMFIFLERVGFSDGTARLPEGPTREPIKTDGGDAMIRGLVRAGSCAAPHSRPAGRFAAA
jgi:hypothetical protein